MLPALGLERHEVGVRAEGLAGAPHRWAPERGPRQVGGQLLGLVGARASGVGAYAIPGRVVLVHSTITSCHIAAVSLCSVD